MNCSALMKCKPYLYIRLFLPSVCHVHPSCPSRPDPVRGSPWSPGVCPSNGDIRMGPAPLPLPCSTHAVRLLGSTQSDESTVNALTGGVSFFGFIFIMCNVVALTFYATIYEDLCCTCNKYIEKAHTSYSELYGCVCWGGGTVAPWRGSRRLSSS